MSALDGMQVTEVTRPNPMGRQHLHLRALATIGGRSFEFVKLLPSSLFEVYDFPKSWKGLSRFVGYLTEEQGSKLMSVIGRRGLPL